MGIKLYQEPEMGNSILFCGWPGIGNIGISAIDTFREMLRAREFGEIEPEEFFNPRKVIIESGLLKNLEFPRNKFYFRRIKNQDIIIFIGEEQPTEGRTRYAKGGKAYQMANLVLDVGARFGCRRVYTSGAAVTQIHHTTRPRVWAVPNNQSLVDEVKDYENTVLMSDIEGRSGQGTIAGLNGLMLGVAQKRNIEAVCLMGEIPYYLQGAPWPYPKASQSVLEVIAKILDVEVDMSQMETMAQKVEDYVEEFLERLYSIEEVPPQLKEEIEKLRDVRPRQPGPITEEEQKKIMEHIDELFNLEGGKDEGTI